MGGITKNKVLVDQAIKIERVEAYALSVAVENGPVSSLGKFETRNGLLIAITDSQGVTGWGEIWCNFPQRGALGRINLLQDTIVERLLDLEFYKFDEVRPKLELDFHLNRQTGGLSRDMERGISGISFLMRFMVFNIVPILLSVLNTPNTLSVPPLR